MSLLEKKQRLLTLAKQKIAEGEQREKANPTPAPAHSEISPETDEQLGKIIDAVMQVMNQPAYKQLNDGGFYADELYHASPVTRGGRVLTPEYMNNISVDRKGFDPTNLYDPMAKVYSISQKTLAKALPANEVAALENMKFLQDAAYMAGQIKSYRLGVPYAQVVRSTEAFKKLQERIKGDPMLQKSLYTSGAAQGAEWIPTGFSSELIDMVYLELRIAGLFRTIPMPTNPYTLPVVLNGSTGYLVPQSTTDTSPRTATFPATNPTTGATTFNAKKLGARSVFTEEINEDSIIGMLEFIREDLAQAIGRSRENAILNGDLSGTHMDTGVTAATDARKAFSGHRYIALNNAGTTTLDFSGTVTADKLSQLRDLMGKYGVNPQDLAYGVSPKTFYKIIRLSEVRTADKYGQGATILTGEIGDIDRIPVIVSEFVQEGVDATGIISGTPGNNTQTVVHLVNRRGFLNGERGGITVQSFRDPETDEMIVLAKHRMDFQDAYDALSADFPHSVMGINVDQ